MPSEQLQVRIVSLPTLGKLLGAGKEAEAYVCGTAVMKLYKSAAPKRSTFREAANLALAGEFGLPVPTVLGVHQIGDRWGVLMTRVDGPCLADAMRSQPGLMGAHLKRMAKLHLRVHAHPGMQFAGLKARLVANIREVGILGSARQDALLDKLAELPDGDRLCHGDFHGMNILGLPGEETVIDWLDARRGDPAADVCRSFVLMQPHAPELASAYVDHYAEISEVSRDRILAWLPVVAAARLAERVPDQTDALLAMADSGSGDQEMPAPRRSLQ
jgi:aminoglycoside phosphotransferase (APT) family kinase protein